ncbi:hypothetical protein [Leifsonia shinshuensis]|uniref:Uncharacterized protein n=1 Tax=Leifsonia shinshuensis TaxID=150026 RepID=A0A853CW05_9MICO|nr:hypothetical protein [Leifsonia shinshuensis]NYJ24459.1 hypothetical protein [Leifsonia shinshuensis]
MEIRKGAVPLRTVTPRENDAGENLDGTSLIPLLYATRTAKANPEGQLLRCAACGSDVVSPTNVETYVSEYDELQPGTRMDLVNGSTESVTGNEALRTDYRPRGNTVGVFFRCEMGHRFVLELARHKGQTMAATYSWIDGDESWWNE